VHPRETVDLVLADRAAGLAVARISRERSLPRSTVRDWCAGRVPAVPAVAPWSEPGFPEESYCRLLGTYLGDGHIAHAARTQVLRISCDAAYPRLIADTVDDLRALRPDRAVHVNRRRETGCVVVQASWRSWSRVFPQHGPGPKHLRAICLTGWQRELTLTHPQAFVRGLINSDGCRYVNRVVVRGRSYAYPSYEFKNASSDIHGLLREHLDLLGIAWRRAGARGTAMTTRDAVARLDEFVGPKR